MNSALPSFLLCHLACVGFYSHVCPQMAMTNQSIMSTLQRMMGKEKGLLLRRFSLLIWSRMPLPSKFVLTSLQPEVGHLPKLRPIIGTEELSEPFLFCGDERGFPFQHQEISAHSFRIKVVQWVGAIDVITRKGQRYFRGFTITSFESKHDFLVEIA